MKNAKRVAIEAALKSGRFIKGSVGKTYNISYKGRDNLVTDIDKKSEHMIIDRISSAFPEHSILSEESSPRSGAGPYKWIIDPLDGTTNFAHAFPFFAVSIGLERSGKIEMGVVYDPMRDELFYAESGKGAYLNGKKIHVSRTKRLTDSFLATGFPYGRRRKGDNVKYFRKFLVRSLAVRRAGSASLDLSYVACGRFDGFWEMGLHPWDSAAGMIIIEEAGGSVTTFAGSDYTPYHNKILATNGNIHEEMVMFLKK